MAVDSFTLRLSVAVFLTMIPAGIVATKRLPTAKRFRKADGKETMHAVNMYLVGKLCLNIHIHLDSACAHKNIQK